MTRRVAGEVLAVGLPALIVLLGTPAFDWSVAAGLLACAVLPLRHVSPRVAVVGVLPGLAGGLGWGAGLVALYALGRGARSFRAAAPWLVAPLVATVAPVLLTQALPWQQIVVTVGYVVVNVAAPAVLGQLVGTRARLVASLAELDAVREAAAAARADAARAEERARIGREIHDAVGHHVTLIAVGAAAIAASTGEDRTRAAAEQLRGLARRSLGEVRAALGLAGGPPGDDPCGSASGDVAHLVDDWRAAGLEVTLDLAVTPAPTCPVVDRAAYCVVQESLTNAARHAPGAAVHVTVARAAEHLDVRVRNTAGRRPALVARVAPACPASPSGSPRSVAASPRDRTPTAVSWWTPGSRSNPYRPVPPEVGHAPPPSTVVSDAPARQDDRAAETG